MSKNDHTKSERVERIRRMVKDDFGRISDTEDPWVILNISPDASWESVASKYERYERFYRSENFQKLGDMELTRQALDIRRAVSRAMVEIESQVGMKSSEVVDDPASQILDVDLDAFAMGDIYFRDGLTYLRLGDFDESMVCFRRSCDHDPTRGIAHAYRTYTHFRQYYNDPRVVEDARKNMAQATRLGPKDPDICVLVARFHLKLNEKELAQSAIAKVAELNPDHPKLEKLRLRLEKIDS